MLSKEKEKIIFIRLFPNEELNEQIKKACKKHKVKAAVVLSGIGQVNKVKIGYFKKKGDYSAETFEKPLEILTLAGNICKQKDEYITHFHIVLGDERKNSIGGHFIEGEISVTAEIVLLKIDIQLKRKIEEDTGLQGLYF